MPYGERRGFSDHISGRQAQELQAATEHADAIASPLLWRIHINWSRTALGDDQDGSANAAYRAALGRWFRHPDQGDRSFHGIYVRERPERASSGPNDHIHIHVPEDLVDRFLPIHASFLPPAARSLDRKAIMIDPMGWTTPAREGALLYLLKGTAPGAARLLGVRPSNQGRVYGKRCGVSETLSRAARERHNRALADTAVSDLVA